MVLQQMSDIRAVSDDPPPDPAALALGAARSRSLPWRDLSPMKPPGVSQGGSPRRRNLPPSRIHCRAAGISSSMAAADIRNKSHRDTVDQSVPKHRHRRGNGYSLDIIATAAFGLRATEIQPADPTRYHISGFKVFAPAQVCPVSPDNSNEPRALRASRWRRGHLLRSLMKRSPRKRACPSPRLYCQPSESSPRCAVSELNVTGALI